MDLNSPERYQEIRKTVQQKPALKFLYTEVYEKYQACIKRAPAQGSVLEIGSGAGFAKDLIPELITSDVVAYAGVDKILDATHIDFPDNSLACICMFNVLHHVPDTPAFFREALRCLVPGGRIIMVEPYPGWIGSFIYRYIHHEDFDPTVKQWEFVSNGPVSDANNALPYVIFERDRKKFFELFPDFTLAQFTPHTPLRYWLSGGLKSWSLLPSWAYRAASWLDNSLIRLSPKLGSFVDIEIVKR